MTSPAKEPVLKSVHTSKLKPNLLYTNAATTENEARIDASFRRLGTFKPIIVRTLDDGSLEILGGEHRWLSAKRLGTDMVSVFNLGVIPDDRAKEISLVDNARYGEDDTLQLSDLLRSLGKASDLATFLPFTDHDLDLILATPSVALSDLDMPAAPAADTTRTTPTHQVLRFKIPIEDTAWITAHLTKVMRDQNYSSDDSMTNAGNALVHILNQARDAEVPA